MPKSHAIRATTMPCFFVLMGHFHPMLSNFIALVYLGEDAPPSIHGSAMWTLAAKGASPSEQSALLSQCRHGLINNGTSPLRAEGWIDLNVLMQKKNVHRFDEQ